MERQKDKQTNICWHKYRFEKSTIPKNVEMLEYSDIGILERQTVGTAIFISV